jgi:predicted phosphodiesterase
MRIAVLSDIHGNIVALDAVLADARAAGVEQFWMIGDFAAIGPEPAAVLERVTGLGGAFYTRGNSDRYILTGEGPPPSLTTVQNDPALIPTYAGIAASIAWTRGFVTATGWLDWLADLPLEIRQTTPAGIRLLAIHASPGTDDGEGVHAGRSNAQLAELLATAEADIVLVGHTHEAMLRAVGPVLVVNIGSVSNPTFPDLRASYVVLEITSKGVELEHRRVNYDHSAFIERVHRSRHPGAEFILSYQRGERRVREPHRDHTPIVLGEKLVLSKSTFMEPVVIGQRVATIPGIKELDSPMPIDPDPAT